MARRYGDSLAFARVSSIRVVGHYIVATDRQLSPHVIVLDRLTGQILKRFGRHGAGPAEFRDPQIAAVSSERPARLWIYDFTLRRMVLADLERPADSAIVSQYPLNVGYSLLNPIPVGERILSNGLFADKTLVVIDPRTGRIVDSTALRAPFSLQGLAHPTGRRLAGVNVLVAHPTDRRYAVVYQFTNRVDFLDSSRSVYASARGPRAVRARFHVERDRFFWDQGNEMAYTSVAASQSYLFALFCGLCSERREYPSLVHVFGWNGEFVGEFALSPPALEIATSADGTSLYGFADTERFPVVGAYPLARVLQRLNRLRQRP